MKTFLILACLQILNCKSASIKILDNENGVALANASVSFECISDDCPEKIKHLMTNKLGFVHFPGTGEYKVTVRFVGYELFVQEFQSSNDTTISLIPKPVQFDEIVSTGQYIPQSSQKSIFPVEVINNETVEAHGANNLRELLITQNNISIEQDNILGSAININGVTGRNVKILVDGVPVIGRLNGNIDISQVTMANVKQVEIVKGPMSVMYGTDALGGVINIITNDASSEKINFTSNTYIESVGQYNVDGQLNLSRDNIGLFLNGGRNLFQGYDQTEETRFRQWKPKEQLFGGLKAIYALENHSIRYSGDVFHEFILNRGQPRGYFGDYSFDDKYKTLRLINSLDFNGNVGDGKYYEVTASYSNYRRQKNKFYKDLTDLSESLTSEEGSQDTSFYNSFLLRATFSNDKFASNISYQWGFEMNLNEAESNKIAEKNKHLGDYGLYLSMQYEPWDGFAIQPAARAMYNTIYDAPITPSLHLLYGIFDFLVARASYARGFRAPGLQELYFNFVDINHDLKGNENLKAERSHNFNFSLAYTESSNEHHFKLEPAFFYNEITDLITLSQVAGITYNYINIGDYSSIGGNLKLDYVTSALYANLGVAYIGRQNQDYVERNVSQYSFSPELSVNITYKMEFIDTYLDAFYKLTGTNKGYTQAENEEGETEIREYEIESYNMLNLSLRKELFDKMLTLHAGIKNLFDVNDLKSSIVGLTSGAHTASNFPVAWGRSLFINAKFNLN